MDRSLRTERKVKKTKQHLNYKLQYVLNDKHDLHSLLETISLFPITAEVCFIFPLTVPSIARIQTDLRSA